MRLWSIAPHYLDRQGLLALWREGLLAQKVLLGNTKGYKNHPQLERFKIKNGIYQLRDYLYYIGLEAKRRRYNFNLNKVGKLGEVVPYREISVTTGQLEYEMGHLMQKLYKRDKQKYYDNLKSFSGFTILHRSNKVECKDWNNSIQSHPLFKVIKGGIESWERVK